MQRINTFNRKKGPQSLLKIGISGQSEAATPLMPPRFNLSNTELSYSMASRIKNTRL